ncbi:MAG: hypothetical protein Q7R95_00715 [bacterium]|nr:hypothetical protein [bacterium]
MSNFNLDQSIAKVITTFIISLAFFGSIYISLQRLDTYLLIKAVDDCAKISRAEKEIVQENVKVVYPLTDAYKTCLKDKGIK